tara:strand:- start:204 stop:350 length:147 start_codon:yes stop_codon:yes gene_type:complete
MLDKGLPWSRIIGCFLLGLAEFVGYCLLVRWMERVLFIIQETGQATGS